MEGNQYDKAYKEEMERLLREDAAKKARKDFKNLKKAQQEIESEAKRAVQEKQEQKNKPDELGPVGTFFGLILVLVIALGFLTLFHFLAESITN